MSSALVYTPAPMETVAKAFDCQIGAVISEAPVRGGGAIGRLKGSGNTLVNWSRHFADIPFDREALQVSMVSPVTTIAIVDTVAYYAIAHYQDGTMHWRASWQGDALPDLSGLTLDGQVPKNVKAPLTEAKAKMLAQGDDIEEDHLLDAIYDTVTSLLGMEPEETFDGDRYTALHDFAPNKKPGLLARLFGR